MLIHPIHPSIHPPRFANGMVQSIPMTSATQGVLRTTQTTQENKHYLDYLELGITQNYLGNPMEGQTIQLLRTTQEITQNYLGKFKLLRTTQIYLELLRTTLSQLKSSYFRKIPAYLGNYLEQLRNYLGNSIRKLLRITQKSTQNYLELLRTTQEITQNYLGIYLEPLRTLLRTTQIYSELLRKLLRTTQEFTQNHLEHYLELLRSTQNYLGNYLG